MVFNIDLCLYPEATITDKAPKAAGFCMDKIDMVRQSIYLLRRPVSRMFKATIYKNFSITQEIIS